MTGHVVLPRLRPSSHDPGPPIDSRRNIRSPIRNMPVVTSPTGVRCFGQRILNPFRGVMHSVVTKWADAVTVDGRNWTLYVQGECLYDDLDAAGDPAITVPDVKYGSWSAKAGFRRAPIRMPTFDKQVSRHGEHLLSAVQSHAPDLPFALADRFELWVLNTATGLPLALLASACTHRECRDIPITRWTPGQACMAELPDAHRCSEVLAAYAGPQPIARWFERQDDGSGVEVDSPANTVDTRRALHQDLFPPLQVDRHALTDDERALLDAVHAWQAPAILHLPTLSRSQRRQFEALACRHALRVAGQLPLFPEIVDEAMITAALVEARLRRSLPRRSDVSDNAASMSPDYVEIPD